MAIYNITIKIPMSPKTQKKKSEKNPVLPGRWGTCSGRTRSTRPGRTIFAQRPGPFGNQIFTGAPCKPKCAQKPKFEGPAKKIRVPVGRVWMGFGSFPSEILKFENRDRVGNHFSKSSPKF